MSLSVLACRGTMLICTLLYQVAATHNMCGSLSNPLLVLPVQAVASDMSSSFPAKSAESINPELKTVIGAGFQDYEASIMRKLQKVS